MAKIDQLQRDYDKAYDASIAAYRRLVKHLRTVGEDARAEQLLQESRMADHHATSAGHRWRNARDRRDRLAGVA